MARCSKKTVGGGGRQTCNGSQAKGPAAILIFEAKKKSKAKRGREGKAAKRKPRQGKQPRNRNTTRRKGGRKREKETGGKNKRSETTRRDGKEGQKRQREGGTKQKQRKTPRGKAPQTPGKPTHTPNHQTTRHPPPKRWHLREGPNETRCASIRSHQSSRCAQGTSRQLTTN